jgi:hypothetical protein
MTWSERFRERLEEGRHEVDRLSSANVDVLYAEIDRLRAWMEWMETADICHSAHSLIRRALDGEAAP